METNQPGLPSFRSSQNLGLIKFAMMAKKEQEETTPDNSDQITCTKISQELKKGGYSEIYTSVYWTGTVRETSPH